MVKKIKSALISVYHKENLENIIRLLSENEITIYSTGGTYDYIKKLGIDVIAVEAITEYPSILGGRVKTLHPKVFGGILARRTNKKDQQHIDTYEIPEIDLVVVDLYPFKETVTQGASHEDIIEKIDIGGISLIRAAAKNYNDVVIISSKKQYIDLEQILENNASTNIEQRKTFAKDAFMISSDYDTSIYKYFAETDDTCFNESITDSKSLRYGENPHQKGIFYGKLSDVVDQLNGKEISYNNLLDIDAAINLIDDFEHPTFAVIKHNNACGVASRDDLFLAWKDALAGDPISAFGGIVISNRKISKQIADDIHKLFYEVLIAPDYDDDALEVLKQNKKRIILKRKNALDSKTQFRSLLNGVLYQQKDTSKETTESFNCVTDKQPGKQELSDMEFANIIVKHTKSNAIVLAKNKQLIGSGVGQTSRVDALKQAIIKAKSFDFNLEGAVMASDAFFPFADSVEISSKEGIKAVIQPGGSIRDKDSIDFCNQNNMTMAFTGRRHFKH